MEPALQLVQAEWKLRPAVLKKVAAGTVYLLRIMANPLMNRPLPERSSA